MKRETYSKYGFYLSGIQTMLGNKQGALRALQAAYEYRHIFLLWNVSFPEYFPWESDPLYKELQRYMSFRY